MSTRPRNVSGARSSSSRPDASRRRQSGSNSAKASYEKYINLARASARTGDVVETENYYQHAEHYYRMMNDAQE